MDPLWISPYPCQRVLRSPCYKVEWKPLQLGRIPHFCPGPFSPPCPSTFNDPWGSLPVNNGEHAEKHVSVGHSYFFGAQVCAPSQCHPSRCWALPGPQLLRAVQRQLVERLVPSASGQSAPTQGEGHMVAGMVLGFQECSVAACQAFPNRGGKSSLACHVSNCRYDTQVLARTLLSHHQKGSLPHTPAERF